MPKKSSVKRHLVTQPSDPSYRLIPLTRNQNAVVDTADFEWLSKFNWYAQWNPSIRGFYAACHGKRRDYLYMHRMILGCKKSEHSDHRNHDTLDNRRENLRKCTRSQNQQNHKVQQRNNTSGVKGVFWHKGARKWMGKIFFNGKYKYLGLFDSLEEAALAYDAAAKLHHGEFASFNRTAERST